MKPNVGDSWLSGETEYKVVAVLKRGRGHTVQFMAIFSDDSELRRLSVEKFNKFVKGLPRA